MTSPSFNSRLLGSRFWQRLEVSVEDATEWLVAGQVVDPDPVPWLYFVEAEARHPFFNHPCPSADLVLVCDVVRSVDVALGVRMFFLLGFHDLTYGLQPLGPSGGVRRPVFVVETGEGRRDYGKCPRSLDTCAADLPVQAVSVSSGNVGSSNLSITSRCSKNTLTSRPVGRSKKYCLSEVKTAHEGEGLRL